MPRYKTNEHPKFFYGWWIVVVSGIGLCLGYAPIIVYSFGAIISLAFTLANLMQSVSSPLAGRLADRFGTRKVILVSTAIFASLLVSSHLLSATLWNIYVFYGLLGFVGSGSGP